jgi:hypothetical protein
MAVYLVISLPRMPYINRIYMVLANSTYFVCKVLCALQHTSFYILCVQATLCKLLCVQATLCIATYFLLHTLCKLLCAKYIITTHFFAHTLWQVSRNNIASFRVTKTSLEHWKCHAQSTQKAQNIDTYVPAHGPTHLPYHHSWLITHYKHVQAVPL